MISKNTENIYIKQGIFLHADGLTQTIHLLK